MAALTSEPPRNVPALGVGFGIGIFWIVMAVTALWSSVRGYTNHRYDWGLMWAIIGILLLAAGTLSMVATWWHLTRVRNDH